MSHDQSTIPPAGRHPVVDQFPPMDAEQYDRLKESIGSIGQQTPCLTWRGLLVDGAHRERACAELGITCLYEEMQADSEADMIAQVRALNLDRRHLTDDQLSVIALRLKDVYAAAARERQKEAAKHGRKGAEHGSKGGRPRNGKPPCPRIADKGVYHTPKVREATSTERAAAAVGVPVKMVERTAAVAKKAPDLIPKIAAGNLTVSAARSEVSRREASATPPQRRPTFQVRGKRSEMAERLAAMPGRDWRFLVASSARSHRGEISELIDTLREILDYDPGDTSGNAEDAPSASAYEEGYA
jgi:hypothetical protein